MVEVMRIAVVGALGKGKSHAAAIRSVRGAVLSAIVDRDPDAAAVAAELGVPFFRSVEAMIGAHGADAALCAVPHPLHRAVEVPCFEAGLHVLSEKPLAATPSDAKAIVDAARRHRRVLAVM